VAETAPKGGDCAQDPACRPVGRLGMQKSLSVEEIRTSSRSVVTQATSPLTVTRADDAHEQAGRRGLVWLEVCHTGLNNVYRVAIVVCLSEG